MADIEITTMIPAKAWRDGPEDFDGKRTCRFVIEIVRDDGRITELSCQGNNVTGRGGPAICAYFLTDAERGRLCPHWYHMCEVPLELATNCCWDFQMLIIRCVGFWTSYGQQEPYFSIRRRDWDKDVHRCYVEEPTFLFCPYCGAGIEWRGAINGR